MARGQITKFNKYQLIFVFTIAVATSRSITGPGFRGDVFVVRTSQPVENL